MPDPINWKLTGEQLVERIMRLYPSATLDEVVEEPAAFGGDVRVTPELRRRLRRKRPAEPQ